MSRSIVLITVDCLRADHVGFGGYPRPITPFLDALAAESLIFSNAIVGGTPTYYSLPAVLAARPPLALGRNVLGIAPGELTLASALRQAGYATAAFSAGNPYISPRFGYDQGFDVFRDFLEREPHSDAPRHSETMPNGYARAPVLRQMNRRLQALSQTVPFLARSYDELYFQYCQRWAIPPAQSLDALRRFPSADQIVDEACSWIASVGKRPFFLWLHFMDPHAPYYPKEEALELMGGKQISAQRARYLNSFWQRSDLKPRNLMRHRDHVISLYDAAIRWVDAQTGRLVDTLRSSGLWDNCVFALTADHGEEFLDHGGRFHPPTKLMEELIHVPLLLRVPASVPEKMGSPFSMVHLAPTMVDAAAANVSSAFDSAGRWKQICSGAVWNDPAIVESVAGCTNPFHRDSVNRLRPRLLAVRETRYKLIFDFAPGVALGVALKGERLFDLETDPRESNPLSVGAEPAIRRRLLEFARGHIEQSINGRDKELSLRAQLAEMRQESTGEPLVSATAGF